MHEAAVACSVALGNGRSECRCQSWSLVRAACAGDRDAFGHLYTRHAAEIRQLLARQLEPQRAAAGQPPSPEVEDLTAQVFLRALGGMQRLVVTEISADAQEAVFRGWLRRIARNAFIDHVRRAEQRRRAPLSSVHAGRAHPTQLVHAATLVPDPAIQVEDEALQEAVRHAVGRLTRLQRQVIVLRFRDELPFELIGRRLQRSVPAVKNVQYLALRSLRRHLRAWEHDADGAHDCTRDSAHQKP